MKKKEKMRILYRTKSVCFVVPKHIINGKRKEVTVFGNKKNVSEEVFLASNVGEMVRFG